MLYHVHVCQTVRVVDHVKHFIRPLGFITCWSFDNRALLLFALETFSFILKLEVHCAHENHARYTHAGAHPYERVSTTTLQVVSVERCSKVCSHAGMHGIASHGALRVMQLFTGYAGTGHRHQQLF